jgi:hypothetical protein
MATVVPSSLNFDPNLSLSFLTAAAWSYAYFLCGIADLSWMADSLLRVRAIAECSAKKLEMWQTSK